MLFSSMSFLILFLPIALAGYFLLPKVVKNLWLLVVSMVFYAWGEPEFVKVMAVSIGMNYGFGLAVDRLRDHKHGCRLCLIVMVGCNLALLGYFKYMNFFVETVNRAAGQEIFVPTKIALPIGISFFTFQAMSYVIDVYRKHGKVQKNILNVGLYIAFFPQLIAGPIVRYETFSDQIYNRKVTAEGFTAGIHRFLYGFIKKVLVANTMAVIADYIFTLPAAGELTTGGAWLGAIAYTFQIYFDFSAYSDMAIGLGRLFGFYFPENFRYPYMAESITDFWRRWHISLSTWFRDYVYIPLGGSRVDSRWKLVRNLFTVWFLTGVWHGANWTFICWGLFYFVLLTGEKLFQIPERAKKWGFGWLYRMVTLLLVICSWVLFRSASLGEAALYLKTMFGLETAHPDVSWTLYYVWEYRWYFLAAIAGSTPVIGRLLAWADGESGSDLGRLAVRIAVFLLFLLAVSELVMGAHNPFIYFNF